MRRLVSMTSVLAWAFVAVLAAMIVYGAFVTGNAFVFPIVRE